MEKTNFDHPATRRSIFIGIATLHLEGVRTATEGDEYVIPYRFLGHDEELRGVVQSVKRYGDGTLVLIRPSVGSEMERWEIVPIWISAIAVGQSGILTTWVSNRETELVRIAEVRANLPLQYRVAFSNRLL